MKIALVVHDFLRTVGHGRYAIELAARFRREHEVHVFANTFDSDLDEGIHRHRVSALRASALTTVLTFPIAAAAKVGDDFDIVHAQGAVIPRCNVITAHICNQAWFRARRQESGGSTAKDWLFRSITVPMERWAFRPSGAREVIAISEKLRRELASHYHRSQRVHVIPHGVDLARFNPAQRERHRRPVRDALGIGDAPVFLFIGDARKGARTALRAVAREPTAHLIVVSSSPLGELAAEAKALGIEARVHACGPTREIEKYFAAADAFLFPTPYDAFGMVITEAMASGLPVITSAAAGAAELIRDGEDGFVVASPVDGESLAARVNLLVRDPELRARVGAQARKRAESFSWDEVARRTLEVYRQAQRRRPR